MLNKKEYRQICVFVQNRNVVVQYNLIKFCVGYKNVYVMFLLKKNTNGDTTYTYFFI